MADEQSRLPGAKGSIVPKKYGWASLLEKDGEELETQYRTTLEQLSRQGGMLGEVFKKAKPDIQNPATLVESSPGASINPHKRGCLDALVNSLESKLSTIAAGKK